MNKRDDFSEHTKKQLARRAGYRCSFPGCGAITVGPNDEAGTKSSSIGMACHISAASAGRGSKRFIASMTAAERKDIKNGIWMCYTHGELIDTDESRFSLEILNRWKEIAEQISRIVLEKQCEYKTALKYVQSSSLAIDNISIKNLGNENELIGNFIIDSCLEVSWGKNLANAIRDYVIEHTRNALHHGNAKYVNISTNENYIEIIDDGNDYNPRDLLKKSSRLGGTLAIENLLHGYKEKIVFVTERLEYKNLTIISILTSAEEILDITPCSVRINLNELKSGKLKILVSETCKEIYIILPRFLSISDAIRNMRNFTDLKKETRELIFIAESLSDTVLQIIQRNYPSSQIIVL
jgi:hypothetical protein